MGCVRRDAHDIPVYEECNTTVSLKDHPIDGVVVRAPLASHTPHELGEVAPVYAIARHRQADEALAVAIVPTRLAIVDWE